MKKPAFFVLSFSILFLVPLAPAQDRPNVILIMADDMGISDISPYGGEIETPNLQRLADDGLRFTQFYNTARCCPTRASLLTGLYPHQAGVGHMVHDRGHDGYRGDLNRRCVTIAEVLGAAGYATYMSGKWHLAKETKPEGPRNNWPRQRGFDRFFGTIHGGGSFYDPSSLTLGNEQISAPIVSDDFYYTDAISEFAALCIYDHHYEHGEKPFFLYVPYTCPHWPMHARERDIEKYKGRYAKGWDALRAERHQRMIELGIVSPDWEITPRDPAAKLWETLGDDQPWFERRMEVYAAMIDSMDQGIGRIIDALENTGELDNTLILFLADNGGCAEENGSRGEPNPPEKLEPMTAEELQPDMVPFKTRDGRRVRRGYGVMPGPADTYLGYGLEWANASNTPFRRYKHWVHEGGISSPLIAHWPAGIKPELNGELEHTPSHLIDIMATCVDLAGANYPKRFHDNDIQPLEGLSLAPAFNGQGDLVAKKRSAIYWEHEGNRAVRVGDLKLVAKGKTGPWELYNLKKDRTETDNLADKLPEKVSELAALWEKYAVRTNVLPWPTNGKKKNTAPTKEKPKPGPEPAKPAEPGA